MFRFLVILLLCGGLHAPRGSAAEPPAELRWIDLTQLPVEGRGWTNTRSCFDRLPASAQGQVPESVWNLSQQSAGLLVRFRSDSPSLSVRWTLTSSELAMRHMPATGVSGIDLYVRTGPTTWRWLAIGQPNSVTNEVRLFSGLPPENREYLLYLPLYNGVRSVALGIPPNSRLEPAGPWGPGDRKPIVFYGTSITQGGCASRPGMAHVAQVGRRLNYPTINLGFSGSGRMEPALGELLAQLDPSVYVLDCLPNLNAALVTERTEPLVRQLRAAHPETPIVLVEDRNYTDAFLMAGRQQTNRDNHAALRAAYERLRADGVKHLYYLPADRLLGSDGDDTVDGSHPTDLGFRHHADAFVEVLSPLLKL
ncbi:MAG: SGNH/GDSL hydrolase family protein [Verrucomicrobia bacterium]|nr:SGNH/GDSL hydrolase family protein [Verrucomicrobiota bacterium]